MSARRPEVVLQPAARRDLRNFLLYTGQQWGSEQRDIYREHINRVLTALSISPSLGRMRDDISPGLRAYPVQRHIIYYRLGADSVNILRILHARMDVSQHIDER